MRLGLLLALVATVAEAQRLPDRPCEIASRRSSRGGVSCGGYVYAQFEFAPANGAGMGTACACTTPTGAKGETLTFTRASNATCTKGNVSSGIANGDLVVCSTDQPAVMPGGDGSGGLGLLVEGASTNYVIRSQEFDSAAWTPAGFIVAAPTITADYGTAPDGTATADRIQFSAAPATPGESIVLQGACPATPVVGSVYLKGVSGSGSVDLIVNLGSGNFSCVTCAFVAGSWSRCSTPVATVVSSGNIIIGNETGIAACGGTGARAAADVLVWGAQCEDVTLLTSYVPTAGTAVTRARTVADMTLGTFAPATGMSTAATFWSETTTNYTGGGTAVPLVIGNGSLGADGPAVYWWMYAGTNEGRIAIDTGGAVASGAAGSNTLAGNPAAATVRSAAYHSGALLSSCQDGTCGAGAASVWGTPSFTRLLFGRYSAAAATHFNGVIKAVCVDSDPARCR